MNKSRYQLEKQAHGGFRGYPIATIAFYGPTSDVASKVAVAVVRGEGHEPEVVGRFFSEAKDARFDEITGAEVIALLESHAIQSVVMTDRIIGCPHEEGTDYPEGKVCPECPFWAGRDRWSGEVIQ